MFEELIPLLRKNLTTLNGATEEEQHTLWTLWYNCVHSGVAEADLVSLVALRSLLDDQSAKLELSSLTPLLQIKLQLNSLVYMRIYLHVLSRLFALPHSHPKQEQEAIQALFLSAIETESHAIRRHLFTFVHQIFLEDANLIVPCSLSIPNVSLIPWLVEYAPSTHVIMNSLGEKISSSDQFNEIPLTLGAYLALKYPLPKTLELSPQIVERCKDNATCAENAIKGLKICLVLLRAFPTLMSTIAPLIFAWSSQYGNDSEFARISALAVRTITEITVSLNSPIYGRPPLIIEE